MVDENKLNRYRLKKAVAMMRNRVAGAAYKTWSTKVKVAVTQRRKVEKALHQH